MNARSTETLHVVIIGSAGDQDTLDSLHQDRPEGGIVPIGCPDPAVLDQVLRPLAAGTRVLFLRAGDLLEPGYLTSLAQHGPGETVVLTPTVTIRPDGARDERLQWRFKHGSRSADLAAEPHIFPDTMSGVVLTIPRHGLQDWGGSGALHGVDSAVGAEGTVDDDENIGLSGLIAHVVATGNQVGLHDGPAVIRHAPRPPGPWGRISHYRHLLGAVLPAWLQADCPLPAWVHQLIIHRLIQVTDADRGLRYPSAGLTAAERAEVAQLLRAVTRRVPASQIEAYCSTPLAVGRRTALVAMTAGPMPAPILPSGRRFRSDQKATYFYTGDMPQEQWKVDGAWAQPTCAKTVDHRYFDDVVLRERIVWLPKGRITAVINGQELPVAPYRGDPRPPETIPGRGRQGASSPGLRRRLARLFGPSGHQEHRQASGTSPDPDAFSGVSSSAPSPYTASSPSDWPRTWLYMDRHDSAGDNAEPLYRYARTHAPSVRHIFVLERSCPDWERLAQDGFVLLDPTGPGFDAAWSGAETILLSDIGDPLIKGRLTGEGIGPDQRLVFLQHGVTMRDMWRWFNGARLDVVVCATDAEQAGLTADHTSYTLTDREVWRTGFPRHDHLYSLLGRERDSILLAPTWDPEVSRALESDPDAVGLLSALYRPWLELAAGLTQAGHRTVLFAHPKLVPHAPEWFGALGVPAVTGRDLPETLARSWAVVSDRSSVLDEGMIAGCVGIVWDPRGRPDTDRYRSRHEAIGAIGVDTSAQVHQVVEDVVAGRVTASEDLILLDAGACARLTALLRRDLI
ncbi:hypothetical protein [Actinomyces sp. oral taxon 171]|uniref:hypothetical protein n=1 Tax=Actinomyces sp. oral taxon 171 TaxID=706438 RepID=UPI0001F622F1|nr:hypothetical protein [Actinomyces sp. oral taxon 171]EFW25688.1 hypothetical protein HMPREF9057_02918 [Actinomyces sp. oral taxon 171 str. F0337]QCT32824.1 hypothetical protein FBF36_04480 [Actinomyces sp. oral taxon 171 str. F0337]